MNGLLWYGSLSLRERVGVRASSAGTGTARNAPKNAPFLPPLRTASALHSLVFPSPCGRPSGPARAALGGFVNCHDV